MVEKELRKMNRTELIEIIYALKKQESDLSDANEALKKRLEDREIQLEEAGSIADAALRLNGVFEAAQKAADDYLNSVRASMADHETVIQEKLSAAQTQADTTVSEAQAKADATLSAAQTQADTAVSEAQAKADALTAAAQTKAVSAVTEAQAKADATLSEAQAKADALLSEAQTEAERVKKEADDAAQTQSVQIKMKCENLLAEAQKHVDDTKAECETLKKQTRAEADQQWKAFHAKCAQYIEQHNELQALFKSVENYTGGA